MYPCARRLVSLVSPLCLFVIAICALSGFASAQIPNFSHIVIVVQENRTPDNLFQGLCSPPYGTSSSCSIHPTASQYDIQTSNWLDKTSSTGTTVGETQTMYPCFEHTTLSDLLDTAGVSWKYYAPGPGTIWAAPNAIDHICQPNALPAEIASGRSGRAMLS